MKTILEWLNEAKEQGYEWADAAISNYDPKFMPIRKTNSLIASLETAFVWGGSPEGYDYWRNVRESLRPAEEEETPALETLIQELGELNNALRNIAYNDTLKEPYRTQIYDATKASYEEQLAEINAKIAGVLGIEPIKERKLIGWVATDQNGIIWRRDNSLIKDDGYWERRLEERLTPMQAMALCGRVPKWSDDEPTPIYQ